MVVDRISLIYIKNVLETVEENNGKIDSILLHRTSNYGTKTLPRFNNLNELRTFIDELHKYSLPKACECHTKNEGIYNILNFSFKKINLGEENLIENSIFLNNLQQGWETAKPDQINAKTSKELTSLKSFLEKLRILFANYACFPYIEFGYVDCDYIEIIKNDAYYELIELYKKTRKE